MKPIRLLIADDHSIVRKGIIMYLRTEASVEIIAEAESGQEAIRKTEILEPDVILMDLVMANGDGLAATQHLKQSKPKTKIIILSTFKKEEDVRAVMAAGADGYLLKDADGEALIQAIQDVQHGDMPIHSSVARYLINPPPTRPDRSNGYPCPLTKREKEVLELVAMGLSNKAVAEALSLSPGTVKIHVSNILGKLHATSRTEAAMLATQQGIITPAGVGA